MEFLRTICKDPQIEAKAWETLTLEEKIPVLKLIAKVAHYDAINGTLEIALHNADKGRHPSTRSPEVDNSSLDQDGPEQGHRQPQAAPKGLFALKLAELKHVPYRRQQAEISKEPPIRQNLILAHQIQGVIASGRAKDLKQAASWLYISPQRLNQIMNLLLLAPGIQEDIICSEDKSIFAVPEYKLRDIIAEVDWDTQQKLWNNLLESYQK